MAKFSKDAFLVDNLEEKVTLSKQQMSLYGGAENWQMVKEIPLKLLQRNSRNHFRPIEGEKWEEFLASIREQGILTPLLVREIPGGKYEILAGHNRMRAAEALGLEKVPAIVKKADDVEASFIMANTNLQREEVSDLEKGWAYRVIYEAIKNTGQNQYTKKAASRGGTQQSDDTEDAASHQGIQLRSDEIIAQKYGVGRNTVNRKIRLTYLLPALYRRYEDKRLSQEAAEQLSYLKEPEQAKVEKLIRVRGKKFDLAAAKAIRKASREAKAPLSGEDICRVIGERTPAAADAAPRVKRYKVEESLFPREIKKSEREDYIRKALRYVQENGIAL